MAYLNHIHIYNPDRSKPYPTFVDINGQRINGVRSIEFRAAVGEVPTCTIELLGIADVDVGSVDVRINSVDEIIDGNTVSSDKSNQEETNP